MKRILTVITGLLIQAALFAQTQQTFSKVRVIDELRIPRFSSLPSFGTAGAMIYMYSGADSGLYLRNQNADTWLKMNGSGGASSGFPDTIRGQTVISFPVRDLDSTVSLSVMSADSTATYLNFVENPYGRYIYSRFYNANGYMEHVTGDSIVEWNIFRDADAQNSRLALYPSNFEFSNYNASVLGIGPNNPIYTSQMVGLHLGFSVPDSLFINYRTGGFHNPATSGKYLMLGRDTTTGAIVGLTATAIKRQTSGTPSGTADSQGTQGDMLYDSSYIYIKTAAGWKRVSLATW